MTAYNRPRNTPKVPLSPKSQLSIIINTPAIMRQAEKMSFESIFSFEKNGDKRVTKRGKVEKLMVAVATVDTCIDARKLHQWRAKTAPAEARTTASRRD